MPNQLQSAPTYLAAITATVAEPEPMATRSAAPAEYRKPEITDLGNWQNMTLIYSLPIGPGGPPSP